MGEGPGVAAGEGPPPLPSRFILAAAVLKRNGYGGAGLLTATLHGAGKREGVHVLTRAPSSAPL